MPVLMADGVAVALLPFTVPVRATLTCDAVCALKVLFTPVDLMPGPTE